MRHVTKLFRSRSSRPAPAPRARLAVEALESRLTPYAVSGNAWPHPELITIGFVADGTQLAQGNPPPTSNLFAKFNSLFGQASTWQNQILKAAQQWAAQTNINFVFLTDTGGAAGSGLYQQGDPTMADIRVAGYNFGTTTLASAYMPPPINNYSIAGDINLNTNQIWNIGTTYDLYTVAVHEFGHALGLNHSNLSYAAMFPGYNGIKSTLNSDDISGIRNIYSGNNARAADAYDAAASNGTFGTASDLTSTIDPVALTALATNLDVTTTADKDYYKVTVPAGTTGTLVVNAQSSGLSLLAPKLTVYAGDQVTVKGSANGLNHYGTTLTVTVNGVSAGETYYFKVEGADTTAFGTGTYALTLNFGGNPNPTVPLPNTATGRGSPTSNGGGSPEVPGDGDTPGRDSFDPNEGQDHHPAPVEPGAATLRTPARSGEGRSPLADAGFVSQAPTLLATARGVTSGAIDARPAVIPVAPTASGTTLAPSAASFGKAGRAGKAEDDATTVTPAPAANVEPALPAAPREDDTPRGTDKDQAISGQARDVVFANDFAPASHADLTENKAADVAVPPVGPAAVVGLALVVGGLWVGQPSPSPRQRRLPRVLLPR